MIVADGYVMFVIPVGTHLQLMDAAQRAVKFMRIPGAANAGEAAGSQALMLIGMYTNQQKLKKSRHHYFSGKTKTSYLLLILINNG